MKKILLAFCLAVLLAAADSLAQNQHARPAVDQESQATAWIRINQLGYTPAGIKVAVWGSKSSGQLRRFELVDAETNKVVFKGPAGRNFGAYGPFQHAYRPDLLVVELLNY
jgi:endoglucanase